jgi:hypothetical protein
LILLPDALRGKALKKIFGNGGSPRFRTRLDAVESILLDRRSKYAYAGEARSHLLSELKFQS